MRKMTLSNFENYILVLFSFFFFQAEDGIRDTSVTGVQTCALPILRPGCGRAAHLRLVGGARLLQAAAGWRPAAVRDLDAAAQRDRRAAPGPCPDRHDRRHYDPLPSYARRYDAVGPRERSCRHRYPGGGGAPA